jgi:hypothetical protein
VEVQGSSHRDRDPGEDGDGNGHDPNELHR